jgi:hypothetical protein
MSHISIGKRRAAAAVGVAALALALVTGAVTAVGPDQAKPGMAGNEYAMVLDSSNAFASPSSGSGVASTAAGNQIRFGCSGASASEGGFIKLASGGSLYNSTVISGMTSIGAASDKALTLTYWWSGEDRAVTKTLPAGGAVSFFEGNPSHFRLKASSATSITTLVIKYTCSAQATPATVPTTGAWIVYDSKTGNYKVKDGTNSKGSYTGTSSNVYIPAYYNDGRHGRKPVTTIGDHAFVSCGNIKTVQIPSTVTNIGPGSFQWSSISSISIPSSVKTISSSAFNGCKKLQSVTIPSSVTSIGTYAFNECSSLRSVTFGGSSQLTTLGDDAFYGCGSLGSISIPSRVQSIGKQAFMNCTAMTSITLPATVTSLGASAFENCTSLTKAPVPRRLTTLSSRAFYGCSKITSINFGSPSSLRTIGSHAFYKCTALRSVTLPNTVTTIGEYAFYCCRFSTFKPSSSLQSIGPWAFYRCESLKSFAFPDSLTSLGRQSFDYCKGLTSIVLPPKLTKVSYAVFNCCTGLKSLTIPVSMKTIDEMAFYFCTNLVVVNYQGKKPEWNKITQGKNAFGRVPARGARCRDSLLGSLVKS